jgi:hypothetical protein
MRAQLSLMPAPCAVPEPALTVSEIRDALPPAYHTCRVIERPITNTNPADDPYRDWDTSVATGKSYLVGDGVSMAEYLKRYTSPVMPKWMKLAYLWASQNPNCCLLVDSSHPDARGFSVGGYTWHIGARGDHVEYIMPHQDSGGEKCWVSRDGRTRLLVNED